MKIVLAGYPKTGTKTSTAALEILGGFCIDSEFLMITTPARNFEKQVTST